MFFISNKYNTIKIYSNISIEKIARNQVNILKLSFQTYD